MSEAVVERADVSVLLARVHALLDELRAAALASRADRRGGGAVAAGRGRGAQPAAVAARAAARAAAPGSGSRARRPGRVRAAEAAGPRRTLTGEPLPAIYPAVAAAPDPRYNPSTDPTTHAEVGSRGFAQARSGT